jgi:hypothetical protein
MGTWLKAHLAPEEFRPVSQIDDDGPARLPTTPFDRARALKLAERLFTGLRYPVVLPERLQRQIPYVLRHFPHHLDFDAWAKADAWEASQDPAFIVWLAPEVVTLEEKLAAFDPDVHAGEVMPFLSEIADDEGLSEGSKRRGKT